MVRVEIYPVPFVPLDQQDFVLQKLVEAGADGIQWDVMDGRYNPNNTMETMGPERIRRARERYPTFPFEAHLMIAEPWRHVREYADCDFLIPHLEACRDRRQGYGNARRTIEAAKALGKKVGLALEPETPLKDVLPYAWGLDLILVMTVPTGYAGQPFVDVSDKVSRLVGEVGVIEVDGGMNAETARLVREKGATRIVAASFILKSDNFRERIRELRGDETIV